MTRNDKVCKVANPYRYQGKLRFPWFRVARDTLVTSRTRQDPDTAAILCRARLPFLLQFRAARSVAILFGHSFETTVVQCL
jgi:hypothetical protein